MKILIAPDSFKGSLNSKAICQIARQAFKDICPTAEISLLPLADGGEGSLSVVQDILQIQPTVTKVHSAAGTLIRAKMLLNKDFAFIESAQTVGLPENQHIPLALRSSKGIGQQIKLALENDIQELVLSLGGSATNDAGVGMLQALDVQFLDSQGQILKICSVLDIHKIQQIDCSKVSPKIAKLRWTVLCDVNNPLLGKQGASAIFGPQKGLSQQELPVFEKNLKHLAGLVKHSLGQDISKLPGAGGAGGLGFGAMFLGGKLVSGSQYLLELLKAPQKIEQVDAVITGEGCSDSQTLCGKLPSEIAKLCRQKGKLVYLVSGSLQTESLLELLNCFDGCFATVKEPMQLADAIDNTEDLLYLTYCNLAKLLSRTVFPTAEIVDGHN